jgi:RNA polymerase sigma-70 factor (ECF subfamily)
VAADNDRAAGLPVLDGLDAIAAFLRHRAELRGAPLRVVPTRANTQPAFGCYLPDPHAAIARPYGLIVLTLDVLIIYALTVHGRELKTSAR